ncbi:MAG: HIT family protein [Ectothiorhodospiraceae bacterium]|nr:HIT family protein [Ectothiorhodospiraceae bacterium]
MRDSRPPNSSAGAPVAGGSTFSLDSRLAADTWPLFEYGHCLVLLNRNAAVRWLIVVPRYHCEELYQLPPMLRRELDGVVDRLSAALREGQQFHKVNVAALGNVVSQLHVHVIGRRRDDPCWPAPGWGRLQDEETYSEQEVEHLREVYRSRVSCSD